MKLFGTVVRFVGLFQSLNLYFIDHGLVSSPLLHLCTAEAEWLLPVSPKSDTLIHCLSADDLSFYVGTHITLVLKCSHFTFVLSDGIV